MVWDAAGGVNGRIKGTRLGRGFQVLVRAGRHGCHRCGRSAGGRLRTRHVHSAAGRQGAAAAGGAGVHTRCGDSSPHRLGVGSGGDGAGGRSWTAGLQVPAGRPGAGPAGGEGVWGRCGNSSLPGHGPTGVGAVGGAGPRGGPRPSRHPGRSRTRAGGAGAGLGPAPAARGRHPELLVRRWSAGRGREPRVGRDQQRTRAEGEWGLTGGRAGHSGDNPE